MSANSSSALARPAILTHAQANEVLRYWLASLQLEEALATRPRARKPLAGAATPRLETPSPGHEYFKLPLDDGLEALMREQRALHKPFDAELSAFFETWLAAQYRRGDDDRDLSHMVAFPVVHMPRGDLAGLLRYGVRVRFGDASAPEFKVPTRSQRRRKEYPSPPSEVRLAAVERAAQKWPFFVDTRLLQQQLGVARENIDAFFATLRAEPEVDEALMLRLLCELLEREWQETKHSAAGSSRVEPAAAPAAVSLLQRLAAAMTRLLAIHGGRARVYPVAIVVDATRAKTTWYLQRELQMLIEEQSEVAWDTQSCLGAYLTADALPVGMAVQRALFPGPALSESQRVAAERTWGSRLTAVQGPPGTGKTTLILHLAAHALVSQVDRLADQNVMGHATFVVSSTNNRAVDNVIDPLNTTGLPLALRAGSQRVCEHVLAPVLQTANHWLTAARARPMPERVAALASELEAFKSTRSSAREQGAARALACEHQTEGNVLRFELERIKAQRSSNTADGLAALDARSIRSLYEPLQKAQARLKQMCELCEAPPGLTQLNAIDKHYRRSAKRELPALTDALRLAGLKLDLPLPPPLPPSVDPVVLQDAWQAAAEAAFGEVDALALKLARALGDARLRERETHLERQLAQLGTASVEPEQAVDPALQVELFQAAVRVREAWAAVECETLGPLVQRAYSAARSEYSLRSLWSDDLTEWKQLTRLFGVWGCTLLSLGNCFPARAQGIDHVVIDEAGQCHPSYAVSALMRSRSALIIGDVHQLEPVIDLEPADDERVRESCKLTLPSALLAPYRVHSEARCSVQALADRAVLERPRLSDHFRCQPEIIAISDALCRYGLRVHTPPASPSVPLPFLTQPVSFIDVSGEQERAGGSWQNVAELAVTLELLQALLSYGVAPEDMAVITPYRGQLEQLHKQIARLGIPLDRSMELVDGDQPLSAAERGLTLGTVHRFQGGERSIVLFTSVVTRKASLAFLDQRENLLNVAVSRARHRFIALGDRGLLAQGARTALLTNAATPLSPDSFRRQLLLV
ncbi:MAG: hypothetical protein RL701_43 [Pseudomonadota bacterium]